MKLGASRGGLEFSSYVARLPDFHRQLLKSPSQPLKPIKGWDGLHAVYVFLEEENVCHVGRTRNLLRRLRGHLANSHNSATFAFSQAKRVLGYQATYRKGEGRADLFKNPEFIVEFERQRTRIKKMQFKFLEIKDPVEQYLLELYLALEFNTSLDEFRTS